MKMTNAEYGEYVKRLAPKSKSLRDTVCSFIFGGLICCVGEFFKLGYLHLGLAESNAKNATSITLIFLGTLLTALHLYDRLAKIAKAGALVPITGFANAVTAPAIEFRSEGFIAGTAAKMFVIAGPVIVYGVTASVVYGFIYYFFIR